MQQINPVVMSTESLINMLPDDISRGRMTDPYALSKHHWFFQMDAPEPRHDEQSLRAAVLDAIASNDVCMVIALQAHGNAASVICYYPAAFQLKRELVLPTLVAHTLNLEFLAPFHVEAYTMKHVVKSVMAMPSTTTVLVVHKNKITQFGHASLSLWQEVIYAMGNYNEL